jgi:hypothetical protein
LVGIAEISVGLIFFLLSAGVAVVVAGDDATSADVFAAAVVARSGAVTFIDASVSRGR